LPTPPFKLPIVMIFAPSGSLSQLAYSEKA